MSVRRKPLAALLCVLALLVAACGGGESESSNPAPAPAPDFPASTITGQAMCDALDADAVATALGGNAAGGGGVFQTTNCLLDVFPGDSGIQATRLAELVFGVENEGGQAGYDAWVADWSTRSSSVTPIEGVGSAAAYLDAGAGPRVVVLTGDRVVVASVGPIYSDAFPLEAATAVAQALADGFAA